MINNTPDAHTATDSDDQCVYAEIPGERNMTAEDLWQIPRVGTPQVGSNEQHIVVPVTTSPADERTARTQLWMFNDSTPQPTQLTPDGFNAGAASWSPDRSSLTYTLKSRTDDDAQPQLYWNRLDGGVAECLTDLPLGVFDAQWLPDGSGLVIAAKLIGGHATIDATRAELERRQQDPVAVHASEQRLFRFWDQWLTGEEFPHLFHLDLGTRAVRDLTPDSTAWFDFMTPTGQFDIAPDGREVVFAGLVTDPDCNEVESRLFIVPINGGQLECITPDAPAGTVRPRYAPDGSTIVYGRKEDRYFYADRPRLYRYHRQTGEHTAWCAAWDQAPSEWTYTPDGSLLFVAECVARTHLYKLQADEDTPRLLATGGTIAGPQIADDGVIYFTRQSLQQPSEVYRCGPTGEDVRPVTRFTEQSLSGIALGEVRAVQCEGAGGETVQSFVILPPNHDAMTPAPFVNVIHGGPHGVWGDQFHYRWNSQVFAAGGYVVALPNFQGSTSWGNDFSQRIQGAWAERPFADVMAVTDHLIQSGLIDGDRMAAAGGSYGGYLVAWIAGHTDRFQCLVNHAGVYDTLSMYASDATWGRGRSFGGLPWDGLEAIDACNPARFTAGMSTPMLVIHGERDYRVPVTQSLACYGVLQAKGVPSRLLHFPDENHWILKAHNSKRWYQEVLDWIDRWLGRCVSTDPGA